MQRKRVTSSNIKSIGYDRELKVLEVEFLTETVYQYQNVPYTRYQALMLADSKGKYFNAMIKNRYEYKKVR